MKMPAILWSLGKGIPSMRRELGRTTPACTKMRRFACRMVLTAFQSPIMTPVIATCAKSPGARPYDPKRSRSHHASTQSALSASSLARS